MAVEGIRKPAWLRRPTLGGSAAGEVRALMDRLGLHTVCREADCPNLGRCFESGTATFLILGDTCTRGCRYCAVGRRPPGATLPPPDPAEPLGVAEAAAVLGLSYVVITSVTRDDIADGGAGHFSATVAAVRNALPGAGIEVLTPDFGGSPEALAAVAAAGVTVFNHNLETVRPLFAAVRPGASYDRSLEMLAAFHRLSPGTPTKSGLMLGMGESAEDVRRTLGDLACAGVSLLTLGQYLAPSRAHWPVDRYVDPAEFDEWKAEALGMGFESVMSGPLVRSSFHAGLMRREGSG
jgi:lipoic acid synthetase